MRDEEESWKKRATQRFSPREACHVIDMGGRGECLRRESNQMKRLLLRATM